MLFLSLGVSGLWMHHSHFPGHASHGEHCSNGQAWSAKLQACECLARDYIALYSVGLASV